MVTLDPDVVEYAARSLLIASVSTVIASVVIGGTSLFGGEGGVFGTVVGVLLIGVLGNGLTLLNVSSYYQQILIGLIIVFAVYFDHST